MEEDQADTGRGFLGLWMLASLAGGAVGLMMEVVLGLGMGLWIGFFVVGTLYLPLMFLGDVPDSFAGFPIVIIGALIGMGTFGLVVGVAQSFVLQRSFHWHKLWEGSTMAGYASGLTMLSLLIAVTEPHNSGFLGGVMMGALVGSIAGGALGTAQWLVLRRQVPWMRWWVLPTSFAGLLAGALGLAALHTIGDAAGLVLAPLVFWAITGGALVWVSRLPIAAGSPVEARHEVEPRRKSKSLPAQLMREFLRAQRTRHDIHQR